jgi:glutaredoxin 2
VGSLDKSISCDSTQLLRKIDQKMRRIESILRNISIFLITEEKFEVHQLVIVRNLTIVTRITTES